MTYAPTVQPLGFEPRTRRLKGVCDTVSPRLQDRPAWNRTTVSSVWEKRRLPLDHRAIDVGCKKRLAILYPQW